MTTNHEAIQTLRAALVITPENIAAPLRRHLADLLMSDGAYAEAEQEYAQLLHAIPDDLSIKRALAEACYHQQKWMMASVILDDLLRGDPAPEVYLLAARTYLHSGELETAARAYSQAVKRNPSLADPELEAQLDFRPAGRSSTDAGQPERILVPAEEAPEEIAAAVERPKITFRDVGGMEALKDEIRMKIIHPLSHPELYRAYGKQVGGGIMMYGPPGCGKTHLARATAGEVKAFFVSIGIHDVLNLYLGQSEANLHELFEVARRHTPCVLFIDEVDALGANRTDMRHSAGRQVINQFLAELDGLEASNEGVLVLAATNAPWHLDPALRRPGRFDRVIFVPPPDAEARTEILRILLRDKPVEQTDYRQLAERSDGFSGADLKGIVDVAVEAKLREALKAGSVQPLQTKDLLQALRQAKPSTVEWFATARNYALYANQAGLYDDVLAFVQQESKPNFLSRLTFWRDK